MRTPSSAGLAPAGLAATAAALLAGCGGSADDRGPAGSRPAPASSTPSTPAGEREGEALPSPATSTAPDTEAHAQAASPAAQDVGAVAARYLAARENAISYTHPTPRSWLTEAREVMTPTGWRRLSDSLGSSGGFPAATARAHKWSVRTDVSCQHHPDAGPPTATRATLICGVTDTTVDASGNPVPAKALPAVWPYQRPQTSALLLLRQVGGRWLVDADQTGQAG